MILNEEQIESIQQKITYAVKYSDTYDEVYDHVLSTMNAMPESSEQTEHLIDDIIDQDFGGYDNLKFTEDERATIVNKAMRKKHWQHMLQFFNIPFIGLTLLITITGWFLVADSFSRKCLLILVLTSALVPLLFIFYRKIKANYNQWRFGIYQKPSLKDNYIFIAAVMGETLFNLANLPNKYILTNPAITLLLFVFYTVYVLSFFKLYRDEFKMNIAR